MKVVIAPDKFKGSLTAVEVCLAIEEGIKNVDNSIEVVRSPLADGGEGTLDVIESITKAIRIEVEVLDPLSRPIKAYYLKSRNVAFIEMAMASGLQLLKESERNPLYTSTYGTGQLIRDALERGVNQIYLMIGGSATNDAGVGMAQALGYSFKGRAGNELMPVGESLGKVAFVNAPLGEPVWYNCEFTVLSDVQNKLYGKDGAAYVYGEQKGANASAIKILDEGLEHFAKVNLNDNESKHGAGAAGGLGYGALTFLNAELKSGIDVMMDLTRFEDLALDADLIITGEGKFDVQTLSGKVVSGVSKLADENNIPVGILCGMIDGVDPESNGFVFSDQVMRLAKNSKDSMNNADAYLSQLAEEQIGGFIKS